MRPNDVRRLLRVPRQHHRLQSAVSESGSGALRRVRGLPAHRRGPRVSRLAGRVVTKGQTGIRLVAPDTIDDSGKVHSSMPAHVFDVTQTDERTPRAAVAA